MPTTSIDQLKRDAKLPARQAGDKTVKEFFLANKNVIASVLPKHINPDKMLALALGALRKDAKLMECTTESLMAAVMTCAQLGLELGPQGHVYLGAFKNARKGVYEVQVLPGYPGLIELATRSDRVLSVAAQVVREGDKFDFEFGSSEHLRHRPSDESYGSKVTHAYAYAKLAGGGFQFFVMSARELDEIAGDTDAWRNHPDAMRRKCPISRLCNYIPSSPELRAASALHIRDETGVPQDLQFGVTIDAVATKYIEPTRSKKRPAQSTVERAAQSINPTAAARPTPTEQADGSFADVITGPVALELVDAASTQQELVAIKAEIGKMPGTPEKTLAMTAWAKAMNEIQESGQ